MDGSEQPGTTALAGGAGTRRRGRPRLVGADQRILAAALTVLSRVGYERLRIGDVAAEAGVAKTTVYRRWHAKDALVADAVGQLYLDRVVAVDHGDLRSDLVDMLTETWQLLFRGAGHLLEDLVRESGGSRELANVVRTATDPRRRAYHEALNRAVARGELPPSVQHDLLIDLLLGPLWARLLVTGGPVTLADVEAVVDIVLDGVLTPRARRRPGEAPVGHDR